MSDLHELSGLDSIRLADLEMLSMTKYLLIVICLLGTTSTARADLDMWLTEVNTGSASSFVGTNYSTPTVVDIGYLFGERTYEFVVNAGETGSSALMADRVDNGWGIKFEQWNNTQRFGITEFGVADHTSNVPTPYNQDVHVAFVVRDFSTSPFPGFEDYRTEIYLNGVYQETMGTSLGQLSGTTAVGGGLDANGVDFFDVLNGTVKGVATYDVALSADELLTHSSAYFTSVPEPSSLIGLMGILATGIVVARVRRRAVTA